MPNFQPKGAEMMRKLGRSGGLKSGETRRRNRAERILEEYASGKRGIETPETAKAGYPSVASCVSGVTGEGLTLEQNAGAMRSAGRRGGSHDTDWRCSQCRHFNSEKRRSCAKCAYAPLNGRSTPANTDGGGVRLPSGHRLTFSPRGQGKISFAHASSSYPSQTRSGLSEMQAD